MNRKQPSPARKALRSLSPHDLASATGGILIYGSTSLGGPDTRTSGGIIINDSNAVGDGLNQRSVPSGI